MRRSRSAFFLLLPFSPSPPSPLSYLEGRLLTFFLLLEHSEQLAGAPSKSIPGRRPELDRITQQLASYRDTLVRYTTDEAALQREIAALEERRRDKRTKADLVRLRGEYEALQSVQGWKLVGFDTKEVRMRHWGEFDVSFLLQPSNGGGGGKRLRVGAVEFDLRIDENAREGQGLKAQVTAFLLAKVRDEVERVLAEEGGKDIRVRFPRLFSFHPRPTTPEEALLTSILLARRTCSATSRRAASFSAISAPSSPSAPSSTRPPPA